MKRPFSLFAARQGYKIQSPKVLNISLHKLSPSSSSSRNPDVTWKPQKVFWQQQQRKPPKSQLLYGKADSSFGGKMERGRSLLKRILPGERTSPPKKTSFVSEPCFQTTILFFWCHVPTFSSFSCIKRGYKKTVANLPSYLSFLVSQQILRNSVPLNEIFKLVLGSLFLFGFLSLHF